MSYTIEVYRGKQMAERHFGIYSLYVMFYPQLVAGPIERPQNLLNQFREKYDFDYDRVTSGIRLMVWGLFKKVVVADRLAIVVDTVYSNPHNYNSISLIISTILFSFQIYYDFSGYSDMAIGAARVMGFKLMKNFNNPYQSRSIHEFWKRWHISLSSWFKDYLYISLGGNRVSIPRWYLNLFIVFLISGLWHGANWTFIIWGALHGSFLVIGLITNKRREKIAKFLFLDKLPFLSVIVTFILVTLSWIFFRSDNVKDSLYILVHIFSGLPNCISKFLNGQPVIQYIGISKYYFALVISLIILIEYVQYMKTIKNLTTRFLNQPLILRWLTYIVVIFFTAYFGIFEHKQFIYFQF